MTQVYLAARYSRIDELNAYRRDLEARGHTVTSRWLSGDHQLDHRGLSFEAAAEERARFAHQDYDDLVAARVLIAFTEVPRTTQTRGGRHVELGIGIGMGKEVFVVGPAENVFCCLAFVRRFDSWDDCLAEFGVVVGPGLAEFGSPERSPA